MTLFRGGRALESSELGEGGWLWRGKGIAGRRGTGFFVA
jgi:hypothetical protein